MTYFSKQTPLIATLKSAVPSDPRSHIEQVRDSYTSEHGVGQPYAGPVQHDPEVAKRIADAYAAMPHDPNHPAVKASYDALKRETADQYNHLVKHGYKMEPWSGQGEPYANSKEMREDVLKNKHLHYFPTENGFGTGEADTSGNPLLEKSGIKHGGKDLPYNDLFRAVHDMFGHAVHGYQFGAKGEENAWAHHASMYSKDALPAMTTETRGQNSWVNFGPHIRRADGTIPVKGDADFVHPANRPFADQKTGLLPSEFTVPGKLEKGWRSQSDSPHAYFDADKRQLKLSPEGWQAVPGRNGYLAFHAVPSTTNVPRMVRGRYKEDAFQPNEVQSHVIRAGKLADASGDNYVAINPDRPLGERVASMRHERFHQAVADHARMTGAKLNVGGPGAYASAGVLPARDGLLAQPGWNKVEAHVGKFYQSMPGQAAHDYHRTLVEEGLAHVMSGSGKTSLTPEETHGIIHHAASDAIARHGSDVAHAFYGHGTLASRRALRSAIDSSMGTSGDIQKSLLVGSGMPHDNIDHVPHQGPGAATHLYSGLHKFVQSSMKQPMQATDFHRYLSGNGFSKDELADHDIHPDRMGGVPGKITPAAALSHIASHAPQIHVKRLGDSTEANVSDPSIRWQDLNESAYTKNPDFIHNKRRVLSGVAEGESGKGHEYNVTSWERRSGGHFASLEHNHPGGTDIHALHNAEYDGTEEGLRREVERMKHIAHGHFVQSEGMGLTPIYESHSLSGGENYREHILHLPNGRNVMSHDGDYKSPHWNGARNIVSHIRMKDRSIHGKRALHLEEVQSDWHQAGRNAGYAAPDQTGRYIVQVQPSRYSFHRTVSRHNSSAEAHEQASKIGGIVSEDKRLLPNGPFKGDSWTHLGLKHALHEAANGGYDHLSWNPSHIQNGDVNIPGSASQGMVENYDKKIPGFLNRYLKPFGVEPTKSMIDAGGEGFQQVHSIPLTPELKAHILAHGQPMYGSSINGGVKKSVAVGGIMIAILRKSMDEQDSTRSPEPNSLVTDSAVAFDDLDAIRPSRLIHYSKEPREVIDPSYQGTAAAGQERERDGRKETPRSYFYHEDKQPEPLVTGKAPVRHELDFHDESKPHLYDLQRDKRNLVAVAQRDAAGKGLYGSNAVVDALEALVKSNGYDGYSSRGAVAMFHTVRVGQDGHSSRVIR